MAFDKLECITSARRNGMPASVVLSATRGGRPRTIVSFNQAFVEKFKLGEQDRFDVLLGSGPQKGLLRFKRSKEGVTAPKRLKGGMSFNLGFIERFGTEGEPKAFCNAEVVDADTIEVVLPPWADEIDV